MLMSHSLRVMKSRLSIYLPSRLKRTSEMLEMISEKKLRAACAQSCLPHSALQATTQVRMLLKTALEEVALCCVNCRKWTQQQMAVGSLPFCYACPLDDVRVNKQLLIWWL